MAVSIVRFKEDRYHYSRGEEGPQRENTPRESAHCQARAGTTDAAWHFLRVRRICCESVAEPPLSEIGCVRRHCNTLAVCIFRGEAKRLVITKLPPFFFYVNTFPVGVILGRDLFVVGII